MSGINGWLINLENRVSKLRYNARFDKPEQSDKELERCHSLLEQIYNHASYQKTSISTYIPRINIVQDGLTEIQATIEKKKNSFWRVFKRRIATVISIVIRILGLGDWGGFLGSGDDRPKLLN